MIRQRAILAVMFVFCLGTALQAQQVVVDNCPYTHHATSLSCLVPDLTKTGNSSNLSAFNTTLGEVVGQLPLAVPVSGFVLGFDKSGIPIEINQNLGSVLTERGNTVGLHKLFVGFTFQRFVFQSVDGTKLSDLPTVFQSGAIYGQSSNSLSANVNQYTVIAAFGVTSRVDISATLPFERISMGASHGLVTEYDQNGNPGATPTCPGTSNLSLALCPQSVTGSAKGIGDLLLNIKGTAFNGERSKLAAGLEARFPTGDAYNLLGSGAYGVKPYIVFSRSSGRVTPHLNVGYQWNGFSVLRINPCYFASTNPCTGGSSIPTLRLPDDLEYSAGADIGIVKRVSVVADIIGQRYFDAPRVIAPGPASQAHIPNLPAVLDNAKTVSVANSDYNETNVGLGLKLNPFGRLIVSANALIRLDNNGLRPARFVPLVGLSYRF